jgi:hypothetical protein
MKQLVTLFLLTFSLHCFGQLHFDRTKISRQTEKVVSWIEDVNELMGNVVYNTGIRPAQYDNFTELQNRATQEELVELTNHANGVVRCYAFWALTYKPSVKLLPIVISHIGDTAVVRTQFGCLSDGERVGDFFIDLVTAKDADSNSKKLTPAEFAYLDSLLVYTPNRLSAKEDAIDRAKPSETFYERARALVLKENNQSALVSLARFKRKQDIPLILNNQLEGERYDRLFFTCQAIREFPDNAFLPLLKKLLYQAMDKGAWSIEWRELYKAIASFKNDTALQLLKVPFTQTKHEDMREYHIDFIFGALKDCYAPIYNKLLWAMWENEKKIHSKVFSLLYPLNPGKAFLLTKKTLQNLGDFYSLNTGILNDEDATFSSLIDVMLDTVLKKDRPYAIKLINKNIRTNDFLFPTFADRALKTKEPSFISSLFYRLQSENNPHYYLKATEVLIAFKDKGINKRIAQAARINPALKKDWGGEAFSKLLKDHGIR